MHLVFHSRQQNCLRSIASSTTQHLVGVRGRNKRAKSSFAAHLEPPTVLFHNNHLLAVHKPAGWHSVPNRPDERRNSPLWTTTVTATNCTTSAQPQPPNERIRTRNSTSFAAADKCLLTYCQEQGWGGGSQGRFLLPLHRLDQPCTGVLLLGKTSKAARRIQSKWQHIRKTYYCVVHGETMHNLYLASLPKITHQQEEDSYHKNNINNQDRGTHNYQLSGILLRHRREQKTVRMIPAPEMSTNTVHTSGPATTKETTMAALSNHTTTTHGGGQWCSITWRIAAKSSSLLPSSSSMSSILPSFVVLQVKTSQGRRHMIRALLGQVASCPIVGDLRYAPPHFYNNNNDKQKWDNRTTHDFHDKNHSPEQHCHQHQPLRDQSVALHAAQITLPQDLQLGQEQAGREQPEGKETTTASFNNNSAPIPPPPSCLAGLTITATPPGQWKEFFSLDPTWFQQM